MTGTEVLDRAIADFGSIVRALGFRPKKGSSRAACIICGATNQTTFSFHPDRGTWHCFRCGRGRGVLDLVEAVLGCSRQDAFVWLANLFGVLLSAQRFTPRERRAYRDTHPRAKREAERLIEWHDRVLRALRTKRNRCWDLERRISRWACRANNDPKLADSPLWDYVWAHARDDQEGDRLDALMQELEAASGRELIELRRAFEGVAA